MVWYGIISYGMTQQDAGINHKEFGVTSEGVVVYLDVALRSVLNINPHKCVLDSYHVCSVLFCSVLFLIYPLPSSPTYSPFLSFFSISFPSPFLHFLKLFVFYNHSFSFNFIVIFISLSSILQRSFYYQNNGWSWRWRGRQSYQVHLSFHSLHCPYPPFLPSSYSLVLLFLPSYLFLPSLNCIK